MISARLERALMTPHRGGERWISWRQTYAREAWVVHVASKRSTQEPMSSTRVLSGRPLRRQSSSASPPPLCCRKTIALHQGNRSPKGSMPEPGVWYQVSKGCYYPTPPSGIELERGQKPVLGPSRAQVGLRAGDYRCCSAAVDHSAEETSAPPDYAFAAKFTSARKRVLGSASLKPCQEDLKP
jgi:hypothetical protein